MDLAERHVVVTGASGALGGAVVDVLVERGAIVHAPMVEASPPASAVWLQSPRVLTKPGVDLADEEAVARYFAMLPSLWASVHLVGGFTMAGVVGSLLGSRVVSRVGPARLNLAFTLLLVVVALYTAARSFPGVL